MIWLNFASSYLKIWKLYGLYNSFHVISTSSSYLLILYGRSQTHQAYRIYLRVISRTRQQQSMAEEIRSSLLASAPLLPHHNSYNATKTAYRQIPVYSSYWGAFQESFYISRNKCFITPTSRYNPSICFIVAMKHIHAPYYSERRNSSIFSGQLERNGNLYFSLFYVHISWNTRL